VTKCQPDDSDDKTQQVENYGAAFAALRHRARVLFVAYISLPVPSIKEAAENVSFSYANAREIFASDPFQAALLEWQLSLHREVRSALKAAAVKAAGALIKRIDSDDDDIAIRASNSVLDRAGHAPKQEIDLSANVRTTKAAETPTEDLEAQLAARLAALTPRPDAP